MSGELIKDSPALKGALPSDAPSRQLGSAPFNAGESFMRSLLLRNGIQLRRGSHVPTGSRQALTIETTNQGGDRDGPDNSVWLHMEITDRENISHQVLSMLCPPTMNH